MKTSKYIPSALAALALAAIAVPLAAMPASAAALQPPRFIAFNLDGDTQYPGETNHVYYDEGDLPTVSLSTAGITSGTVVVTDKKGRPFCQAPTTSYNVTRCTPTTPLTVGDHTLKATVTDGSSTSAPSTVSLTVQKASGGGSPVDPGSPTIPNPGVTDPGFSGSIAGLAAPKVELGSRSGDYQQLLVALDTLPGGEETGAINVYNAAGERVTSRETTLGGYHPGIPVYVTAPFGEKTVLTVEIVSSRGTSQATRVVVDRTSDRLEAPTFVTPPEVDHDRVTLNVLGQPDSLATLTDAGGHVVETRKVGLTGQTVFYAAVDPRGLNTYKITLSKGKQTSDALTHIIDNTAHKNDGPLVQRGSWIWADGSQQFVFTLQVKGEAGDKSKTVYTVVDEKGTEHTLTTLGDGSTAIGQIPLTHDLVTKHTLTITQTINGVTGNPTTYEVPLA